MTRPLWIWWLCCAGLLVLAAPAGAQTSGAGTIRGSVSDEQQGRLAGVTLTVTTADGRVVRSTTTDSEGSYRIVELPPATYAVTAEHAGFATLTAPEVVVRAGLNLELPLTMTVAAQDQRVEVSSDIPMLETSTSIRTLNVSGEFQRSLPITARQNWSGFMTLTPGMVTSGIDVGGFQSFFLHGSTNVSHVIQLDGADLATGERANPAFLVRMSSDSTDDVQIKTAALDASSPLGVGVMANVVGQSGTNTPHGAASWTYRPRQWTDNNNPGGTTSLLYGSNVDLSLGGPLKRDRLWLFGTSRIMHQNEGITRTASEIAVLRALSPTFEPFDNSIRGHAYYVKFTGQASPNHQVSVITQNELYDESQDVGSYVTPLRGVSWGGPLTTARLQSIWSSSLTTNITVTYNAKERDDYTLYKDRPGVEVHARADLSGGRLVGTGRIAALDSVPFSSLDDEYDRTTIEAGATYYRSGLAGSHELKSGLLVIPRNRMRTLSIAHGGGMPTVNVVLNDPANPAGGYRPFYRQIYDKVEAETQFLDTRNVAVYLQDAWRPTARLTVNAGVRIDHVVRHDRQFDVEVQNSTDVAPRVGVNYALTADARNVLRASWGKIHDNLTTTIIGAGSVTNGYREEYDLDFDGTFETVFTTPSRTAISSDRIISDDYHQPYILEWTAGYQRQLPGRVTVEANVLQREYNDYPVSVDINGIYEGNQFVGYRNPDFNQITLVTPNRYYWPVYTGFDAQVTKRSSRWQLLASYVRQWRHMAGSWALNDPASFIQPNAFSNDKGIGATNQSISNSLTGTAYAGYQGWRDHVVRAGMSARGPWQTQLATVYTYQSGMWSGPIVRRLPAGDPAFGPPTVVLSNGRIVSNPLATVVRFANATAGDGQFTSDGVHTWNVRVGRQFALGRWRFDPALDFLNLVNAGSFQQFIGGANEQSSPNYQRQANIQVPRSAMFSLRLSF
jgi:hypothetical protein